MREESAVPATVKAISELFTASATALWATTYNIQQLPWRTAVFTRACTTRVT
jgi:hypothetical protein